MIEAFMKFKGTDWIGMIFGLLSTICVAREKRMGFIFGMICAGGWLAFGLLTGSIASVLSNIFLIGFNAHGWWHWKKKEEAA